MSDILELELIPFDDVRYFKGVPFPAAMKFRQLLVTGPPGCGKTRLINKVGGWPDEGYIDLTLNHWWRAQSLTFRPREVHLGFPFIGHSSALTVFDKEWLEAPEIPKLDFGRILLPPRKTHFFSTNWRARFMLEFLIPSPQEIFEWRLERRRREVHPIDEGVTLEQVERQVAVFCEAALHLHRAGMSIYVRDELEGVPKSIVDKDERV